VEIDLLPLPLIELISGPCDMSLRFCTLHPETHNNGFPKKKVSVETGLQYSGMSSLLGLVREYADGV
jgi:hypothetical protein